MTFANSTWVPAGVMGLLLLAAVVAPAQDPPKSESAAAAVRQFRDAAAFQDRGVYDLAADEWQEFLAQFPADPLAPKARHYLGVCRLMLKQYDAALDAFQRVLREHPEGEMADSTYLNLGLTQYAIAQAGKPESYDDAAKTFQSLAVKFPKSKELSQALYYQGEALYARGHKKEAAEAYQQLVDNYPKGPLRAEALYALGVARQELGNPSAAAAHFDAFLKEFPRHALRAEVIMRRAETLFSEGSFGAAAQWFASAAASKDFALADLAAMRQAQSLEAAQEFSAAAQAFAALPAKFPKSQYRQPALLAAGNAHARSGNLDSAVKAYRAVIESGGDLADDAAHWLARVYLKHGRPTEALAAVEADVPESKNADFAVQLMLDRADALYEIPERRAEAAGAYAALAREHPRHELAPQALYMAAFASLGRGDHKAAASYCDAFLRDHPQSPLAPEVRYVAAEAALQMKDYARADRLYGELLQNNSAHADAGTWKVRRALALHLQAKFVDVVSLLGPAVNQLKDPDLAAEAHYLVGSAHSSLGEREAAATSLSASLAAAPRGKRADEALFALAAVHRETNKPAEAVAALEKLLAEFPDSRLADQATFRLGEYLAASGELKPAAQQYQRLVAAWPESPLAPHAMYAAAWIELVSNDNQAAIAVLGHLLERFPDHAVARKARYARAVAREHEQDYTGALDDIAAFLTSKPSGKERFEALYVQGLCLSGLRQFDTAAKTFRSILSADPKFAGADKVLYELAWALQSAGKPRDAIEAFAALTRDHGESPLASESLYHLGEAAYEAGDFAKAAGHYEGARAKAGASELGEKSVHKLAWSLYRQGKLDEARRMFEAQLADFAAGPLAADAQFMIAESLFGQEKYEAALAAYRKSFARPSANQELQALGHLHAGQALAQQQKWSESFELLDQATRDFAETVYLPELRYEAAWAVQNLGKLDDALARYQEVVDQTEREVGARARFMIGEILFEKKQYKEAIRNFFKVAYGYGHPQSPEPVKVWQASASYEAGRCFEVLQMIDQAKKSYREVVKQFPASDKAPLAKSRLEALGP